MVYWSEQEARAYFESGGECRPERRAPLPVGANGGADGAAGEDADAEAGEERGEPDPAEPAEMPERVRAARDGGEWKKGFMVLLTGLSAERELNGRSGVIGGYDAERGRYDVRLANRVVRALPSCLAVHPLQKQRDANDSSRGDEVVFTLNPPRTLNSEL